MEKAIEMKYTYLLIDIFTVVMPLVFSFDSRVAFYKKWKYLLPAMLVTAAIFIVWDHYFTVAGVWSFNHAYTLDLDIWSLPVEEILFFITVPYSCVFIYENVRCYKPRKLLSDSLWIVLLILPAVFGILAYMSAARAYTLSVTMGMTIFLPLAVWALRADQLENFVLSFLVSILPMLVVNGILTALPVVRYDDLQNCGIRLGTIPIEDFLYGALLLGINICIYEVLQSIATRTAPERTK
ncbi:MAG: lycopene cyclase domain-containing protein [Bacteroidetes bacterium]|nr:lycopene cyclase domain-containing protein [Bacteroidota bacterium]